jgi:D-amino-acid oxidase
MPRVSVVGAGVVGLTCAVRLAEAGTDVDVLARDMPLETTSAVAGGLWLPYRADPPHDVVRWARATFTTLREHAGDERTGVRLLPGRLLHRRSTPEPYWAPALRDIVPLRAVDAPAAGYALGWQADVPLVHTPTYLTYLTHRLRAAGGTLTRLALPALPGQGTVVNCTGLAARALADDAAVTPARGQVALLTDPGLAEWLVDDGRDPGSRPPHGGLTYVLPRGKDVVVGGTDEDGAWSTSVDSEQGLQVLARARALVPALAEARLLGHRVGLRPVRPSVRLELRSRVGEDGRDQHTVHCYGHGGAGWTLAWGCADDVLALVRQLSP